MPTRPAQRGCRIQNRSEKQRAQEEGSDQNQMDTEELAKALQDAVARGDVKIESLGDKVVVNFTDSSPSQDNLPELLKETLNAIKEAKAASGKSEQEVLFGGLEQKLEKLAAAAEKANNAGGSNSNDGQGSGSGDAEEKAKIAKDELEVALREEIGKGLVTVETRDGKVFVTVGAGGAFASGSAELTPAAREIMSKIATKGTGEKGRVTVSGHTDNVPLKFGGPFRDNWDLAAARAASVVQEMEKTGVITADRMQAISYGEAKPIESNDISEGRAKNRRIEIEIDY